MKNIKLYDLIKDYEIHDDGLIFIHYYQVADFFKELLELTNFNYDGATIKADLCDTYLCFNIRDICEECELDWEYVKHNLTN